MTIQERIDLLEDINGAVHTAYPEISNAAKWLSDLKNLDEDTADILLTLVELADIQLKVEKENTEYIRLRQQSYPPLGEQLDTIFHSGVDQWKVEIQAIKDLYPKPGA